MTKKYCRDCKYGEPSGNKKYRYLGYVACFAVNPLGEVNFRKGAINEERDCKDYKPKWYKFWKKA